MLTDLHSPMGDLLSKCLQGEPGAWEAFVDRYAGVIFAAVRRLLGRRGLVGEEQTAEDIAQDVFLRLIKDDFHLLRSYDAARASLVTWLTIVSRSATIDFLRRKRLRVVPLEEARLQAAEPDPAGAPLPAPRAAPTAEISEAEARQGALGQLELPPGILTARQTLLLHLLFDREMDVAQAAKLLGISPQTVRSAKHKAIQRLREYLADED